MWQIVCAIRPRNVGTSLKSLVGVPWGSHISWYFQSFSLSVQHGSGCQELLKIPTGHELPHDRLMTMWRTADVQQKGGLARSIVLETWDRRYGRT